MSPGYEASRFFRIAEMLSIAVEIHLIFGSINALKLQFHGRSLRFVATLLKRVLAFEVLI